MGGVIGRSAVQDLLARPELIKAASTPPWEAFTSAISQDHALQQLLFNQEDELLAGWTLAFRPPPLHEFPAGLLGDISTFADPALAGVPFPSLAQPYDLPFRPRAPQQSAAPSSTPRCPRPRQLYTEDGWAKLSQWLEAQRRDLADIVLQRSQGVPANEVIRANRPQPIAIGQTEMAPFARGLVWDCRPICCVPADFHSAVSTSICGEAVSRFLHDYPDQQLVSHLQNGISLEADVELQTVLIPHLASLSSGVEPVMKEVVRLNELGWNAFTSEPPFVPFYLNGNGATDRKHEPDRPRPVTEGGGPRRPTFDASGLQAISINDASRIHHIPQHYLTDNRPEFLEWIQQRGLTEALDRARRGHGGGLAGASAPTKWCKERKPTLDQLLKFLAILKHAASVLQEPVYVFGDDVKNYFNHMGMSVDELWKMNTLHLAPSNASSSTRQASSALPPLIFVNELRIGFGMHPASNVAQRLSKALMHVFHDRMDEAEESAFESGGSSAWKTWRDARRALIPEADWTCHETRRWWHAAERSDSRTVYPQARLYAALMYTDDPVFVVVGAQRTLRALRAWRQTTIDFGLTLAIPAKWSLGAWAVWLGVVVFAAMGVVYVPTAKLLRAQLSIDRVLANVCEFHEYRSLCGLLEHLRTINLQGKNVMHGLYRPHGPEGESANGPQAVVTCDDLQRQQLLRWRRLILRSAGVSAYKAISRKHLSAPPALFIAADSDACHGDSPSAMAGVIHGIYWFFPVPVELYEVVTTPMLEFLAVAINVLQIARLHHPTDGDQTAILLRTDALTAALTLPAESQSSPVLVAAYQWLLNTSEWQKLRPHLRIVHIFGEANPLADAVSRGKWAKFRQLCAQLGLNPTRLDLPAAAKDLLQVASNAEARRKSIPPPSFRLHLGALQGGLADRLLPTPPLPKWREPGPSESLSQTAPPSPSTPALAARLASTPPVPKTERPLLPPQPRLAHGLRLFTPPPAPSASRKRPLTSLAAAQSAAARATFSTFTQGGDASMAFTASAHSLNNMADVMAENMLSGINPSTAAADDRAWSLWVTVCEAYGTSPLRTAADARDFPQRNAHLLAALMLHAFASCRPRTAKAEYIKPRSALAYPLAVMRIHARWGIMLPSYKALKSSLHHLSRLYISVHGPLSLAPRRAEPMRFNMVLAMHQLPSGTLVDGNVWSDELHEAFIFRRLSPFLFETAHRLAEIVGPTGYLAFSNVTWVIDGRVVIAPTALQMTSLVAGRDYALVAPPLAKSDQFGEVHCAYPTALLYHDEPANAAAAVRDLELKFAPSPPNRESTPLFPSASGNPYNHAFLDRLLKSVLRATFGEATALVFTWHSLPSGPCDSPVRCRRPRCRNSTVLSLALCGLAAALSSHRSPPARPGRPGGARFSCPRAPDAERLARSWLGGVRGGHRRAVAGTVSRVRAHPRARRAGYT